MRAPRPEVGDHVRVRSFAARRHGRLVWPVGRVLKVGARGALVAYTTPTPKPATRRGWFRFSDIRKEVVP